MRQASTTMSCVDEANATTSAKAPTRRRSARTSSIRADVQAVYTTASRRDPSRGPTKTSANRQCRPRKETRSPSERCAHHAASSRTYCQPDKREGLKKTRATTSSAFWAAGNRRPGACAESRLHRLRESHETQRSYHRILSILTLYRLSPIILNEHTLRRRGRQHDRGDTRQTLPRE